MWYERIEGGEWSMVVKYIPHPVLRNEYASKDERFGIYDWDDEIKYVSLSGERIVFKKEYLPVFMFCFVMGDIVEYLMDVYIVYSIEGYCKEIISKVGWFVNRLEEYMGISKRDKNEIFYDVLSLLSREFKRISGKRIPDEAWKEPETLKDVIIKILEEDKLDSYEEFRFYVRFKDEDIQVALLKNLLRNHKYYKDAGIFGIISLCISMIDLEFEEIKRYIEESDLDEEMKRFIIYNVLKDRTRDFSSEEFVRKLLKEKFGYEIRRNYHYEFCSVRYTDEPVKYKKRGMDHNGNVEDGYVKDYGYVVEYTSYYDRRNYLCLCYRVFIKKSILEEYVEELIK
jgi:hypothetical protein